jgi:glyoxylase-like metal-dependent hydrolase (beta-lactamase superfamily II)
VTLYLTPGHTPGSISALIPVKDRGQSHLMSEWGGTDFVGSGLDPTPTSGGLLQHIASLQRFTNAGIAAGADGILSNHQVFDSSLTVGETTGKATLLQKRKANEPNPWVIGRDGFVRAMAIHDACMEAARTRLQEGYR